MVRHDGQVVSEATVLRLLRDERLILPAAYRSAGKPRSRPSRLDRTRSGSWTSPSSRRDMAAANQHDAISAVELALTDFEAIFGYPLRDLASVDQDAPPHL